MTLCHRKPGGALVAGVSTGLAGSLGCSVWLIRMCWVLAALINLKLAILAYLIAALVLPAEAHPADHSGDTPQAVNRVRRLEQEFRDLESRLGR